jgi:penicillin amidase
MSRRRRLLGWSVLAVAVLLIAVAAAGWWMLAGSLARLDGELAVRGPVGPITLSRDALGTVTVEADDRRDVAFGLGFVHAQERYFQMDLQRRVAAGELAALVGKAAIEVDLDHRRHRLRDVAQRALVQLPPDQRRLLDAYRDGVNTGLAQLRVRPFEYLLLDERPQPWRSEDSLLSIAAMYLDLNENGNNTRELALAQMRAVLPAPVVSLLTSADGRWEAPLQGEATPPPFVPDATIFDLGHEPASAATANETPAPGSNNFAVAGKLTATGAALVAGDMHLGLRVPDIWFRTRMRYRDASAPGGVRDLNGVSLPGTPALVAGSNGQIAWAFTNSYGDWADWVRVTRDPNDMGRYRTDEGWAQVDVHEETIEVHHGAPQSLKVEETRWGPILGKDTDGTPLALAWIGQWPRAYNMTLMELEQAGNLDAALAIAPKAGIPPQNFVVGDSNGRIGWTLIGNSIPLRHGIDPLQPADWSSADTGWTDFIAAEDYPRIVDPADGRLWTANNRVVSGRELAVLGEGGHDLGARAQQIADDLHARSSFAPSDMLSIQLDDRAVFLSRWQQLLQTTLARSEDPALVELRGLTANWSDHAAIDSVDYRLVRAFRQNVRTAVLAPFIERIHARFGDFAWPGDLSAEAAVWMLVQQRPAHLLDPRYADWPALLRAAAVKVTTDLGTQPGGLAARSWGETNRAAIRHPLSGALPAMLSRWLDMPSEPLPGDGNMPRVQAPAFGASERFGIMPGHEADSYLQMPGGQSDHPLSPFHGAGHADWVDGRATPLLPGPATHRLRLTP